MLDVRTAEEYRDGHIDGSVNIPLDRISSVENTVKDKSTPLYVHMPEESESFRKLAEFFRQKAEPVSNADTDTLLELINNDIPVGFPHGKAVAEEQPDRGALRCQVWAEKVTRMLQSLLTRYEVEGNKMLKNTGVYVCTVCGFVFVGDAPPQICPVCKVPAWKFEKIEGGAR